MPEVVDLSRDEDALPCGMARRPVSRILDFVTTSFLIRSMRLINIGNTIVGTHRTGKPLSRGVRPRSKIPLSSEFRGETSP